VTGARGFVGPHLVSVLRARGARVIGLGVESDPGGSGLDDWRVADLRRPETLVAALATTRPDAVVHLAAASSAAASFRDPTATFEINMLGTWYLLEAVRAAAPTARVLVVGTGEVYGPQPDETPVGEDAPFRPVSPYGLSKAAADAMAEIATLRFGLDVVRVRPFGHVGPGQTPRFFLPSFAEQIALAEAGRSAPLLRVGNLEVVRDLLDVRDIVVAYALLLERGERGAVYNVCRGSGERLSNIAAGLVRRARLPLTIEVDAARRRPADLPVLVGNPGRVRAATGWRPQFDLERTLDEVLEEWRQRVAAS
jgi:GDP-4-dehydro-6-deoxy-D-mannose reductase